MKLGIDRLLDEESLQQELNGRRLGLVGHPASVTSTLEHSLDALIAQSKLDLVAAFGPQHGMRGEKQDNMIESDDYIDPLHNIPVYSLYGKTRKPLANMLENIDVFLVDLQDIGTRIYTYVTTMIYILDACAQNAKALWILDRPNPAGRPIEGMTLLAGQESFVGAIQVPMRHGLTLGELASWYIKSKKLELEFRVITMQGYQPQLGPGFGWPVSDLDWVNPSPNAPNLEMARCFPGTVLLEGTELSEGRGTTHPLEVLGAPGIDIPSVIAEMKQLAPDWLKGCRLRPCYFQPTFQKHEGKLCSGMQIHVHGSYYLHEQFKPYRLVSVFLKSLRRVHPKINLWRDFYYEYEKNRLAFDVLNGNPGLRNWVDDQNSAPEDLEQLLHKDETSWANERVEHLLY